MDALALVVALALGANFSNGFEAPAEPGGTLPIDPIEPDCAVRKQDIADPAQRALFKPEGFAAELLLWNELFPGRAYPLSFGDKVAVGSTTFTQWGGYRLMTGRYISVPFVPAGPGTFSTRAATSALDWPPKTPYQYRATAKRMRLTISPCYGDFRTTAGGAGDFEAGCRIVARQTEDLGYGGTRCPVVPGRVYFVNIVFADPGPSGFDPATSTCGGRWWDGVVDHICDFGLQH